MAMLGGVQNASGRGKMRGQSHHAPDEDSSGEQPCAPARGRVTLHVRKTNCKNTMNDTPTPETDEQLELERITAPWTEHVLADFARQLERELTELKQSIANLSHPNCQMLLRERDEAQKQRDTLSEALKFIFNDKIANAADMRNRAGKALADINQLEP